MAKYKYYVVIRGRTPGIYDNWEACEAQVKGFSGASFKGCSTEAEAGALLDSGKLYEAPPAPETQHEMVAPRPTVGIAVDGACSGNPGPGEFRAVSLKDGTEVFRSKTQLDMTTNNSMEFMAACKALEHVQITKSHLPVYTDSGVVMAWITKGKAKINPDLDNFTRTFIEGWNDWLAANHEFAKANIRLWDTAAWGENPADFGRK